MIWGRGVAKNIIDFAVFSGLGVPGPCRKLLPSSCDLLKRRLSVETHEILQIRPAKLTGAKHADPSSAPAVEASAASSHELAQPADRAIVKAHAADAWDGSIDYIRGGKL